MQGYIRVYSTHIGTHAYTYMQNDFLSYQRYAFFIVVLGFGGKSSEKIKLLPSSSFIEGAIFFFLAECNFLDLCHNCCINHL